MENRLALLKRAGIKFVYESMVKASMAMGAARTGFDLSTGNRPLSAPVPKVEKADRIRKVVLAVRKTDNRYGSMGLDYHYFYGPLCDVADVKLFDTSSFSRIGMRRMNEEFLHVVEKEDPDLVLSCVVKDELYPKTIRHISEDSRAITCNWFADDHWRFDNLGRHYAPHFNFCVTVDEVSLEKYKRLGYGNILLSQWGANTALYRKRQVGEEIDVSFVGQNYANRHGLLSRLNKIGIDIQCFGAGWENGWVSFDKMIEIYNRSKVNLNFSTSALGPTKQTKARVFDIPACGGFLLTEHSPDLSRYYRAGKEIETFEDIDEAVEKIAYYLDDEEERKRIAERGYQRTLKEHTYQDRFKDVFKEILEKRAN